MLGASFAFFAARKLGRGQKSAKKVPQFSRGHKAKTCFDCAENLWNPCFAGRDPQNSAIGYGLK